MLERVARNIIGSVWERLDDFDHKVVITCLVAMGAAMLVMVAAIIENALS